MTFAAIVYKVVARGKGGVTRSAHVLPGPYATRQAAHNAGVAYARAHGLTGLDVGTIDSSTVEQFFVGTGRHYVRENPTYEFGPTGAHAGTIRQIISASSLEEAQKILRAQGYDPSITVRREGKRKR
jgi:hypothetical protein